MTASVIPPARLFAGQRLAGDPPADATGISRDSRTVRPGEAYVAMGADSDRPRHVAEAVAAGAGVIVEETAPGPGSGIHAAGPGSGVLGLESETRPVPTLTTSHARWTFARASAARHGLDERCPPLLGITGTKGKSTTAHCAWWALGGDGTADGVLPRTPDPGPRTPDLARAARIGTIGWHDGVAERANPQTTPPPEELHAFLAGLPATCAGVALEISSHGGDQQRLAGLPLRALAFTGLGHDHLDYHRSVAAYFAAKVRILRWLEPGGLCVINADDGRFASIAHAARCNGARIIGLGQRSGDARLRRAGDGWTLSVDGADHPLPVRLPGDFNAWNTAAGALLAGACGVALATALDRLARLPAVPGRMELLAHAPLTYVDYAHTPESIAAVIAACRTAHPGRPVAMVFGCAGDRDRTKRAPMARAAAAADLMVITNDNSRSEDPAAIAGEVLAGLAEADRRRCLVEIDRATAIVRARDLIGRDGVVVVAGKGHETYQIIGGITHAWDDRAFVRSLDAPPATGHVRGGSPCVMPPS